MEHLSELEREWLRLAEAATPGPWDTLQGRGMVYTTDYGWVAEFSWGVRWCENMEFTASARTAVPDLAAAQREAEARRKERTA